MYLGTLVVLCVLGAAIGEPMPQYEFKEEWQLWKKQHDKSYSTNLEELEKHLVWLSNKKYIELHNANADTFGFTLAMNHLGDMVHSHKHAHSILIACVCMHTFFCSVISLSVSLPQTDHEYKERYLTYTNSKSGNYTKVFKREPWMAYPETVDWRTKGAVTGIKSQVYKCYQFAYKAMLWKVV